MTAAEAEAPRWRRLEPDERREQILDCAVRLFGERPYAAVSTSDIARAAGVARGLLNHYFGTKRELYLEVVRRMVRVPAAAGPLPTAGSLRKRVEASVDWFLDTVGPYAKTFVAVTGAEGIGADPEVQQIIDEADDRAATVVFESLGLPLPRRRHEHVSAVRAYGGLVKAAMREWAERRSLTRDQVHLLLTQTLLAIVRDVLPDLDQGRR